MCFLVLWQSKELVLARPVGALSVAVGLMGLMLFRWLSPQRADLLRHSQGASKHFYALLVGINRYHRYPHLDYTDADVNLIGESLAAKGFFTKHRLNCTLREFSRVLDEVKEDLKGQQCEVLVFYFAGHAVERGGSNALLCLDSDPEYSEEEHTLQNIFSTLVNSSSKDTKIVVILDCCRKPTLLPMPTMVKYPRHGQFYVLFACGSGQRAEEGNGHGVFTQELAKLIDGQAKFNITSETVAELGEAVKKRTYSRQCPELLCRSNKRWSSQIWNVPRRNKFFVGRGQLLDDLAERLKEPGLICLVATSGLAGVGKSQLLIEFLNSRCRNKRIVWWLNAETELVLQQGLADLAIRANLVAEAEAIYERASVARKAVRALEEELESWILVFDNASNYAFVKEWVPAHGGIVLVTSRSPRWEKTITVPVFTAEESVELLKSLVGNGANFDGSAAADVAELLGHHPLALAQAGGWAHETNMGLSKYAELLRNSEERLTLLSCAPESLEQQDYKSTVAATVDLATKALSKAAAMDLFDVCAMVSPDHIPYDFLKAFYKNQHGGVATEAVFSALLKELCDRSLITAADGDCHCNYDIHRLVQTVRQDYMLKSRDSCKEVIRAAVSTAAQLFDFDLLRNINSALESWSGYYSSLAPHCTSLAQFAAKFDMKEEDAEILGALQTNLGEYVYEMCQSRREAMELFEAALMHVQSDELKLKVTVLRAKYQYDQDRDARKRALSQIADALECFAPQVDDPSYQVEGYTTLACFNSDLGAPAEARKNVNDAEELLTRRTDRSPSMLEANFQEGAAIVECRCGDLQNSLKSHEKVYQIRSQLLGESSLHTLRALQGVVLGCKRVDPQRGVSLGKQLAERMDALLQTT